MVLGLTTNAQITKISLRASGLTCSMCSNSINKALKTIDYVKAVDSDLKTYTFDVVFKPGAAVDLDRIKTKVENAGFTVSALVATINFPKVEVTDNRSVKFEGNTFYIENLKQHSLDGIKQVKILDKGFVSPKEYKMNPFPVLPQGSYHVAI
ncbi:MAG: copper chaperone [Sphingobacteriales bacterium]|jgi:copper chaperone CopZ|nr:MAG: copper chaperone [Sphingobacteriales bacterium]